MVSDARVQQAREHHRAAADAGLLASRHRSRRNSLIRTLRKENPERWTYPALASAVGCSAELIAKIIQGREETPDKFAGTVDEFLNGDYGRPASG